MKPSARFRVFENPDSACARAADGVAQLIRERAVLGRSMVLGLVAGESCLPFFKELIYRHREEGLSLENVVVFNTDEYAGINRSHPASRRSFMQRNLFDHVDIPRDGIHFPPANRKSPGRIAKYDAAINQAGGIDYQILGLRQILRLGLYRPSISAEGHTRRVIIHQRFRNQRAAEFGGIHAVPTHMLSLGHHTILDSRKIIVLAWGRSKAYTVRRMIRGRPSQAANSRNLRNHPDVCYFLDEGAGYLMEHDPGRFSSYPIKKARHD